MQEGRIPVVGFHVIGIEIEGAAEFLFGVGSVPHAKKSDERQRGVRFGGLWVQLNCLPGRRERLEIGLIAGHRGELAQ